MNNEYDARAFGVGVTHMLRGAWRSPEAVGDYSRLFFTQNFNKSPSKLNSMFSLYTTKIRQNADLVNAMSKCPFGKPVVDCPFISYYEMRNERKQIEQIEVIPQEQLDDMRRFHHACMQELVKTRKANFL
ncbi:hypothetical protein DET65_1283 [Sunxiuqinia elliptica]|uniref:Uncharacterized protein n=2 Tax=Sunxiuqinia elliptica TaxID=655355 RepID=A0A4R6HBI1_9BACT|nr:hypothetical protein DET52_101725 [Sunxiuqinia elliptica]TDO64914.1 hypothetical protein DET65_1283 [Sunxiuqinia elliptica]